MHVHGGPHRLTDSPQEPLSTMARPWKWLLGTGLALVALAASFAFGRTSAHPTAGTALPIPSEAARFSAPPAGLERPSSNADRGVRRPDEPPLRQEIRQLLREELRDFTRAEAERAPGPTQPAAGESAATDEPAMGDQAIAAYDHGQSLVRDALSTRVWTPKQAEQLRRLLPQLPHERRRELLDQLFSASVRKPSSCAD